MVGPVPDPSQSPQSVGQLAPLVRVNARSGIKLLHSPIWASRPRVRPAVEVAGMSVEVSCADAPEWLETHIAGAYTPPLEIIDIV